MRTNQAKRRERLFVQQNGKCHYCGCQMVPCTEENRDNPPDNMVTFEHLYSRNNPLRAKVQGEERTVAACFKCNTERGKLYL